MRFVPGCTDGPLVPALLADEANARTCKEEKFFEEKACEVLLFAREIAETGPGSEPSRVTVRRKRAPMAQWRASPCHCARSHPCAKCAREKQACPPSQASTLFFSFPLCAAIVSLFCARELSPPANLSLFRRQQQLCIISCTHPAVAAHNRCGSLSKLMTTLAATVFEIFSSLSLQPSLYLCSGCGGGLCAYVVARKCARPGVCSMCVVCVCVCPLVCVCLALLVRGPKKMTLSPRCHFFPRSLG